MTDSGGGIFGGRIVGSTPDGDGLQVERPDVTLCANCPLLVQPGFEPFCCWACGTEPGHHGPLCHRRYPPLTRCQKCNEVKEHGWAGSGDHALVWWCRDCWETWSAGLPAQDALPTVFVVSLPKCGTTSLQHALASVGYGAIHCYAPKPWGPCPGDRFAGHLMDRAVQEGLSPLALLPRWVNAITQMDCWWLESSEWGENTAEAAPRAYGHFPQITMLEQLDAAYPGAKFILSVRDSSDWVRSVTGYGPLRQILEEAELPGLPAGVGGQDFELTEWFEAHIQRVRKYFEGREDGAFLEVSIAECDAAIQDRLSDFLGVPVSWGHHNASS